MAKPSYPAEMSPPPALSEVWPGLFIGRRPETYLGYDLVISCERHLARKPMENYHGLTLHCPMDDDDGFQLPPSCDWAAYFAADVVREGGKVLIHCTGGLNRSAVVAVRAIQEVNHCTGREALEHIREHHDPFVLCNRAFERAVTGEVLPTVETSAFRDVEEIP